MMCGAKEKASDSRQERVEKRAGFQEVGKTVKDVKREWKRKPVFVGKTVKDVEWKRDPVFKGRRRPPPEASETEGGAPTPGLSSFTRQIWSGLFLYR